MEISDSYTLYQGDCLEVMQQIQDHSIDCIICDLPYGITGCAWDSVIPFDKLWDAYKRICKKDAVIVLFGSQPFTSALVMSNPKWFKHEWIWQKDRGTNFACVKYQPMKEHEEILVFCNGRITYNPIKQERSPEGKARNNRNFISNSLIKTDIYGKGLVYTDRKKGDDLRYPSSIQKFKRDRGLHPTQKPVALLEYLIKTYSNENDVVLDNCMGSGSTGIACLNTNRKFIGIELDDNYFNVAKQRIETHVPQKCLF